MAMMNSLVIYIKVYFACTKGTKGTKGSASFKFGGILDHVLNFVFLSLSLPPHIYTLEPLELVLFFNLSLFLVCFIFILQLFTL